MKKIKRGLIYRVIGSKWAEQINCHMPNLLMGVMGFVSI